jgi:benzoyl-CoA reductase/2-hydroxyglutaryl-CoA dehydratase subunit BcrC/BadD/HgdB
MSTDYSSLFQSDRKPIGYLCTATPPEILLAAGGLPFRLAGTGQDLESAESLGHPSLCGFCKSAVAWAKKLPAENQIIAVNAASCDGCHRLGPLLDTLPAVTQTIALDLPRQGLPADIRFFARSLRLLHEDLCKALGTQPDAALLTEAIEKYRAARRSFGRVLDAVFERRLPLSVAYDASESYFVLLPDAFAAYAQELLQAAGEPPQSTLPKVILAGNMTLGPAIPQAFADAGAHVIGLDFCNIERVAQLDVPPDDDPYTALANAVFMRPLCPRFEPGPDWSTRLAKRAIDENANGVALFSLKFCDNTLFAFPMTRMVLEDKGMAVLTLEGEYAQNLPGQLATRIEAFVEML